MIMAEVDKRVKGYNDEHISLKSLFFADDALMLSHSLTRCKRQFGYHYSNKQRVCMVLKNKFRKELCDDI